MASANEVLLVLLKEIISGPDRGTEMARTLETAILENFPDADDDERFEDLLLTLASYRPGGGEFLYDEAALVQQCERTLQVITE